MFFETLELYEHQCAFIDEKGEEISYLQLLDLIKQFENSLPSEKTLLAIIATPTLATVVAYLAALRLHHAILMLDDTPKAHEVARKYKAQWLWSSSQSGEFSLLGNTLQKMESDILELHPDLALLLSTSGSTGSSKLVRLNYSNLDANCRSIVSYLNLTPNDRAMSVLPLHYSFGLSILHTHLSVGGSMVLTSLSIMSREFWDDFKRFDATSFSGVPYHYEMLRRVGFLTMEFPSLRMMTQAGGKLNIKYVELFAQWALEKQIEFYVMYGQTEATARISYMPPYFLMSHLNSMGIAIPGGELSLIDEEGDLISVSDTQGELVYRGANVMMGYATSSEDLRLGDTLGGVLHTGDMAKKDAEGFFTITGRMKRFLKMFGNRVNLDEVEQLLKTHGFEALVGGEDNRLIIAMVNGGDLRGASAFVAQTCGIHHSAIVGVEVDTFSVSESGKVEYAAFFKPFLKGE